MDSKLSTTRSDAAAKPILSHDDYTVGWISALPLELAAARAMLDEEHPPLPPLGRQDDNIYTLGAIGKHNVVMACLPSGKMGNNSATAIATQMRTTFPAIRFGLMVGIGGGCPSVEHDIRLGDVVVSKPGKNDGGVIQYDFGRTDKEGRFIRNGVLNAPPTVLLNAVSATEAAHKLSEARIQNHLCAFELSTQKEKYGYRGWENDLLFQSDYDHAGDLSGCQNCDEDKLIVRKERRTPNVPVIHYGTIASGNQVMRHGATRERLSEQTGALCFEMEAAGLMDNFPCLVIRGICDYADSHKSKVWQDYAAATAAAYAKELLLVVPVTSAFATIPGLSCTTNASKYQVNVSTEATALSHLPFRRNPFFSGRKSVLESMDTHFKDATFQQAYILQGMGGIGKTQIALEYAYQALERGFHVFWVNCTTFKTLKSDYEVLLQIMMAKKRHDNEEDRTAVLRWLEDHENWVLIFDNAEDAKFPYGDWIPGSNGTPSQRRILFTTRDERLADAIANVKESVPLMDTTESVDLFNANHSQILRRTGEKDIIALVKRLGNLPLAITLASAYLREYPWITMEEYLELLQDFSERSKLFGYKPSFSNYNHSIMSIWEASFIKVQADNPRAADMLTVLGFLENDRIRFTHLEHASENMQMDKLNFLEDITTIRQSIGLLRSLALISFDGKYLSLHPLVHQWLQARLSKHDLIASAITALRFIYNASLTLIFSYSHDCLPISSEWYGHARFALGAIEQHSVAQFEVHEECYLLILCLLVCSSTHSSTLKNSAWLLPPSQIYEGADTSPHDSDQDPKKSLLSRLPFRRRRKILTQGNSPNPLKSLTLLDGVKSDKAASVAITFERSLRRRYAVAVHLCTRITLGLCELYAFKELERPFDESSVERNDEDIFLAKLTSFLSLYDLVPMQDEDRFPSHIKRLLLTFISCTMEMVYPRMEKWSERRAIPWTMKLLKKTHQFCRHIRAPYREVLLLESAMTYAEFIDSNSLGSLHSPQMESCLMESMGYVLRTRPNETTSFLGYLCRSMWELDHDLALWKLACFIEQIDGRTSREWKGRISDRWTNRRTDEHSYKVHTESERQLLSALLAIGIH